jgi:DNA-binding CsgD family transcriptional regulator
MNEISADEAVTLFKAALRLIDYDLDLCVEADGIPYYPDPRRFPKNIGARDFLECLQIYRDLNKGFNAGPPFRAATSGEWAAQAAKTFAPYVSEEDLEKLSDARRNVFDAFAKDPTRSIKDVAKILGKSVNTVKSHLQAIRRLGDIEQHRNRRTAVTSKLHTPTEK